MKVQDQRVSYYSKGVYGKVPDNSKSLYEILLDCKTGRWKKEVEELRKQTDEDKFDKMKLRLPAFYPSCQFNEGSKELDNVAQKIGVICIDIDFKDNPDEEAVEAGLSQIAAFDYVLAVMKSASGRGYFVIIRLNQGHRFFKRTFDTIQRDWYKDYGLTIDNSCSNPNRARYVTYDPEAYIRDKDFELTKYLGYIQKPKKKKTKRDVDDFERVAGYIDQVIDTGQAHQLEHEYDRWFRTGLSLARGFGEQGRELFHKISATGAKYNFDKCDKKYDKFLRDASKGGGRDIASLVYDIKGILGTLPKIGQDTDVEGSVDLEKEQVRKKRQADRNTDAKTKVDKCAEWIKEQGIRVNSITLMLEQDGEEMDDHHLSNLQNACDRDMNFNVNDNVWGHAIKSNIIPRFHPFKDYFKARYNPDKVEEYRKGKEIEKMKTLWRIHPTMKELTILDEDLEDLIDFMPLIINAMLGGTPTELFLILAGEQGTGKTRFLTYLMPPSLRGKYFVSNPTGNAADLKQLQATKALILYDEVSEEMKANYLAFKRNTSQVVVNYRAPYGRTSVDRPRIATFVGTTNDDDILQDPTGNRRYIIVDFTKFDLLCWVEKWKAQAIANGRQPEQFVDKDLLWMEFFQMYLDRKNSINFGWTDARIQGNTHRKQGDYSAFGTVDAVVDYYFQHPTHDSTSACYLSSASIYIEINRFTKAVKDLNPTTLGRALKRAGYRKVRKTKGMFWHIDFDPERCAGMWGRERGIRWENQ